MIQGIIIGLISSFVGFLFAKGWERFQRYLKERRLRNFWTFRNNRVAIVYPMYDDPRFGKNSPKTMAHVEDVLAMNLIVNLLKSLNIDYCLLDDTREIDDNMDLILVCSSTGNRQSKIFEENHELPIHFNQKEKRFENQNLTDIFESPMDATPSQNIDIGLVAKVLDNNPIRAIFLLWGIHGPGTLGAAKFVSEPDNLKFIGPNSGNNSISFLVTVPFHRINADKGGGPREPGLVTLKTTRPYYF